MPCYQQRYYQATKDKVRKRQQTPSSRAKRHDYYLKNRKTIRERQSDYYAGHREEILAREAAAYEANPEKRAAYGRAHREDIFLKEVARKKRDLRKYLFQICQRRARDRGLEFSITEADIAIPEICPVLGIPLKSNLGKGRMCDNSPTIDRADSSMGYIPGNVAVISWKANRLKNDGTSEEHRKIANWMDRTEAAGV